MRRYPKSQNWTDERRAFVLANYGIMPTRDIVERLGPPFTRNMIIGFAYRNGLMGKRMPTKSIPPPMTDADCVGCRWPLWPDGKPVTLRAGIWCGKPVVSRRRGTEIVPTSYCAEHYARSHLRAADYTGMPAGAVVEAAE